MKRITITEASKMLNVSEQCTRMMIQSGQIPGASYHGEKRKTYYITSVGYIGDYGKDELGLWVGGLNRKTNCFAVRKVK